MMAFQRKDIYIPIPNQVRFEFFGDMGFPLINYFTVKDLRQTVEGLSLFLRSALHPVSLVVITRRASNPGMAKVNPSVGSITNLIAVLTFPSIVTSANSGTHLT